jgi:signal transduction histidine kinase
MSARRSLKLPITLGIVMIVLLVVLSVGWVLLSVFGALADDRYAALYWVLLSIGTTFILLVLAGVIAYLVLSIKAINLTRRQSNFIDSVTHELKSPIASMKLYLQTLARHPVDQAQQTDFYRSMLDDLERLDRLINQLLDAARIESGAHERDEEDVELAGLLCECGAAVCLIYRVPPATVEFDVTPCTVRARRIDLDVLFRNLIDNAVKYAGQQPHVEVSLRPQDDGKLTVRISDNGRGIPAGLRRKIFGRFVRVGHELEREKPGTGLGLYIVRMLVRRLGGSIHVHDRPGGPGSVFEVILPGRAAQ